MTSPQKRRAVVPPMPTHAATASGERARRALGTGTQRRAANPAQQIPRLMHTTTGTVVGTGVVRGPWWEETVGMRAAGVVTTTTMPVTACMGGDTLGAPRPVWS